MGIRLFYESELEMEIRSAVGRFAVRRLVEA